jgi:hypothetical protein
MAAAAVAAICALLTATPAAGAAPLAWEQWAPIPGVYDVAGPLSDGRLLLATDTGLQELDPKTAVAVPAVPAYRPEAGIEDYLVTGTGLSVPGAGCGFPSGAAYALQTKPPAVSTVGDQVGFRVPIPGVETLSGLAFDTSGRFGNRLLVTGPHNGQAVVDAVDCNGKVTTITDSAPRMEGGLAVAPPTFGPFGGALIGIDEQSGSIIAVRAEGTSELVAGGLPAGPDVGPDSAGFVPPGFKEGGAAYLADHDVGGGAAHPGTGTVLRLQAGQLIAAGVQEGDLLVSTEAGGQTFDVHCDSSGRCLPPRRIGQATDAAHVEGHLLIVAAHPAPTPRPLPAGHLGVAGAGGLAFFLPYAVGVVLLAALYLLYRRQARRA